MTSMHTVITPSAIRQWIVFEMNVRNNFLHGRLEKVIYMRIPPTCFMIKKWFVILINQFMDWCKLQELGLIDLDKLSLVLSIQKAIMTIHYLRRCC